jgi:hypothetical protein
MSSGDGRRCDAPLAIQLIDSVLCFPAKFKIDALQKVNHDLLFIGIDKTLAGDEKGLGLMQVDTRFGR